MNFYDALYKIAKKSGITVSNIGLSIGKNYSYIPKGKCRNSSPSVSNAAKMLKVCGYTLCAVKDEEVIESMVVID